MKAIFFTGFIFMLSLNNTHGRSKCYKSKICIHSSNEKCGKNRAGEVRRFLDSCDMKEFNCLKNTNFVPTDDKECEDLPILDKAETQKVKLEEPEDLEESDEYDENNDDKKESDANIVDDMEEDKIEQPIEEEDSEDKTEVKKSEKISAQESDEKAIKSDVEELSKDVVEEFDPEQRNEVKKMTYRLTRPDSDEEYEFSRDESMDDMDDFEISESSEGENKVDMSDTDEDMSW